LDAHKVKELFEKVGSQEKATRYLVSGYFYPSNRQTERWKPEKENSGI
jgi:hypothetical protein